MPPFSPQAIILGVKERVESIASYADRLYIGTSVGTLSIYALQKDEDGNPAPAELVESKKSFTRRAIEQLGFIKDVSSLVVLSDSTVTLYPLPNYAPATPLTQAKGAMSFAIDTSVQYATEVQESNKSTTTDTTTATKPPPSVPTVVTRLAVGCRKRIVIYEWKDGELQGVRDLVLPHSPRAVTFPTPSTLVLSYTMSDHVLLSLDNMTVSEPLGLPTPSTGAMSVTSVAGIGAMGKGAFTGLMALGMGAKVKPPTFKVSEGEFVVTKDNLSSFFNAQGQISRTGGFEWTGPPDETSFVKPYICSILPPGTVPVPSGNSQNSSTGSQGTSTTAIATSSSPPNPASTAISASPSIPQLQQQQPPQPTLYQVPVLQIVSSLSLNTVQLLPFPFPLNISHAEPTLPPTSMATLRLLSPSMFSKSPLFVISTPTDRATATAEGSTIWSFTMQSWGKQIDELVERGEYADALTLLDTLDASLLKDKDARMAKIRGLYAVSLFEQGKYVEAIKIFIDLEVNPAKVVALYDESVAGRLATPKEKWIELFGGTRPLGTGNGSGDQGKSSDGTSVTAVPKMAGKMMKAALDGLGVGAITGAVVGSKDDVSTESANAEAAAKEKEKAKEKERDYHRSIENLLVYLGDRRPKLSGALATFNITPSKSDTSPPLSETPTSELFAMPNGSPSSLIPEQLLRYAQVVDTALFKSYLIIRPGLVGSLCRLDNWCEVSEVEEVLRAKKKFTELIDLYKGKKMHDKALLLLKELADEEDDPMDKYDPTIRYLQKLGPTYLDLIFSWSKWVLMADPVRGLGIFTSDEAELPRVEVANFLSPISASLCAKYIEFLIEERQETSTAFHNRLAEIYLEETKDAKRKGDQAGGRKVYEQLLSFAVDSEHYEVDRLFSRLPSDDFFEIRAILLGRLGKHEAALEIYVHRLQDYAAAEGYCKKVYQTDPNPKGVFLTLLRIYLRPSSLSSPTQNKQRQLLLAPALDLISRQSPRLDSTETLQLLPPLVNAKDVKAFLQDSLRGPKVDTHVTREIWKARGDQVDRRLMLLQTRRVKVTDSRICPQCHKRIGNSVIAVHAPRGEVTHYQCREAFSKKKLSDRHR
ncbi:Vacuolar morphogenesis protein 6 [Tulasnella sp. 418]|nr:Vacuolar morphogenesis protein 6 [Tulasnella sp. 418]